MTDPFVNLASRRNFVSNTTDVHIYLDLITCSFLWCCKLPQKEYVLKIEKTVTLKRINNEENKIQSSSDCWHFEVL